MWYVCMCEYVWCVYAYGVCVCVFQGLKSPRVYRDKDSLLLPATTWHLEGHFPLLAEIRFVADQHHHYLSWMELLLQVLQPLLGLVKGILKRQNRNYAGVLLAEPEEQSSFVGTEPHQDLVPECNANGATLVP